nr:hydroxysteroid 11-beta-dehydrogenase 1-like protein isoform X5 [Equus caballus]
MEVGETGVPVGQARAGHPLSRCRPGRAMRVLLLTGLGALFFAYYWDDNFNPASLQGARVLLTGASAGVGEELAYHYARLGSHLVLTAHTEALLQKLWPSQVVGNCRKLGAPKIFYIAADMASPEVPERVVQFALDKLGGLDYLVLNHLGAAPAGTRARSAQATRWLLQAPPQGSRLRPLPLFVLGSSWAGDWQSPRPGELPELRAADFVGAAQPDGQQGLPGGGVLAARPRAHFLLQPLLGGQVRAGRLLRLPAAGAGRAGRERGHHHVRPRPPGPRLRRRGSQSPPRPPVPRGVTRAKAAPGPKAALAVIRGGATRASGVFYPWRFHLLCLLRGWLPRPGAWFIRQELNVTAAAAAA